MPVALQLPDPLPSWAAFEALHADAHARAVQHLNRELHYRREVYARRVATGAMKQAEADWGIAVMSEILGDHIRRPGDPVEHPQIGWHDKVKALEAEYGWRCGRFPKLVQKASMTPAEAVAEIVGIHAILDHYRTWGFGFAGPREARSALAADILTRTRPAPDLLSGAA